MVLNAEWEESLVTCKSPDGLFPSSLLFLPLCRYVTGKSKDTGQIFCEAYLEVTQVRTLFHEWLCTVYSKFLLCICFPFANSRILYPIGEEEKSKQSLQGAVFLLSMAAPHLIDIHGPAAPATSTTDDASPSDGDSGPMNSPPSTPAMDTIDYASPSNSEPSSMNSLPFTPTMNTTDETSPSNDNSSPTNPLPSMDHPPTDTNSGGSEVPLQTPSSSLGELGSNRPSNPTPPNHLSHNVPILPSSDTPTSGTMLVQPPLVSAGNGTFDLTGVSGDLVSESTCKYREMVPGGEKWVAMVRSYLVLQSMPPLKAIHTVPYLFYFTTDSVSSNSSDFQRPLDHRRCRAG